MTLTSCFVDLRFCKLQGGTAEHTRSVWLQYTVHANIERQYLWSGGGVPKVMLHAVFLHTTFPEVAPVRLTSCSRLVSRRHGLGHRPVMCVHLSLKRLSCQTFPTLRAMTMQRRPMIAPRASLPPSTLSVLTATNVVPAHIHPSRPLHQPSVLRVTCCLLSRIIDRLCFRITLPELFTSSSLGLPFIGVSLAFPTG